MHAHDSLHCRYAPHGVVHGRTQMSRQTAHDNSSRSCPMHVRRDGVNAPRGVAVGSGDESLLLGSGEAAGEAAFSLSSSSMSKRRSVRGLRKDVQCE